MTTWDHHIFSSEVNADFLDELAGLDLEDIEGAVEDAVKLASEDGCTEDERANGLAAATIAAIWAGAPFSAGEIVEDYPFIRSRANGDNSEELNEQALELLESVEESYDLEAFIEALS